MLFCLFFFFLLIRKLLFFLDGKLDSDLEEEILDDSEMDEEDEVEFEFKKKKKLQNMFLDEEALDSDQNHFEDDKDNIVKVKSALDQSDEEDDKDSLTEYEVRIKKHDDSISASRSDMKLNLKVNFKTSLKCFT